MSRHIFNTEYMGRPIQVVAGFDRPLDGFFMTIQYLDDKVSDSPYLYCNLDQERSHPPTMEPFIEVLNTYGIAIPESMIAEVVRDGELKMGNKVVDHTFMGNGN